MISDRILFIFSCFGCIIPLLYYVELPTYQNKSSAKIVVGVLSKLSNFEERRAIRATWKKMLPDNVQFHFILGDTFCPFHQLWRLSEDNCNEWKVEVDMKNKIDVDK